MPYWFHKFWGMGATTGGSASVICLVEKRMRSRRLPGETFQEVRMTRLAQAIIGVSLLFFMIAVSGTGESHGAPEKNGKGPRYDGKPLDRTVTSLPPNYPGHDIVSIYEGLVGASPSGTESKSANLRDEPQPPSLQGPFALVCGQPTQEQAVREIRVAYNEDRQIMSVTFLPLTAFSSSLVHRSIIVFREVKGPEETLQHLNASGLKIAVKTYREQHYGVASDSVLHLSTDIYLKMTPQEARDSRDYIGVLLVCRIKPTGDPPELTLLESSLSYATVALPVETFYFQHLVGVELLEIWIFNRKTGAVYLKKQMEG